MTLISLSSVRSCKTKQWSILNMNMNRERKRLSWNLSEAEGKRNPLIRQPQIPWKDLRSNHYFEFLIFSLNLIEIIGFDLLFSDEFYDLYEITPETTEILQSRPVRSLTRELSLPLNSATRNTYKKSQRC